MILCLCSVGSRENNRRKRIRKGKRRIRKRMRKVMKGEIKRKATLEGRDEKEWYKPVGGRG